MIKDFLQTKIGSAVAVAAVVASVGGIATVSAANKPSPQADLAGYTKDQCKNGGWMKFKNPDGTPMFKNQGQCVSFFASGGKAGGHNGDTTNTNNTTVNNNVEQTAISGDADNGASSGSVSNSANVTTTTNTTSTTNN